MPYYTPFCWGFVLAVDSIPHHSHAHTLLAYKSQPYSSLCRLSLVHALCNEQSLSKIKADIGWDCNIGFTLSLGMKVERTPVLLLASWMTNRIHTISPLSVVIVLLFSIVNAQQLFRAVLFFGNVKPVVTATMASRDDDDQRTRNRIKDTIIERRLGIF